MVKKEHIEPGLVLVVNDKRNVIVPSAVGLFLYETFLPDDGILIKPGTKIKCLSKLKSHKDFPGKIVNVEYNGKEYSTYWMELRIQTNYSKEYL